MNLQEEKNASKTQHLLTNLDEDESWAFSELSRSDTSYASHAYHRYPAKFIPHLPRRIILEYTSPNDVVLDPFMGSATAVIEAIIHNRRGWGIDINPVAKIIADAKTHPIDPDYLNRISLPFLQWLTKMDAFFSQSGEKENSRIASIYEWASKEASHSLQNGDQLWTVPQIEKENYLSKLPEHERITYWYPNEKIQKQLAILLFSIDTIKQEEIRKFYLCCFSHILKNCSIWQNSSVKPTREFEKKMQTPFQYFKRHLRKMIKGNNQFYSSLPSSVIENIKAYLDLRLGSAMDLPFSDNSVDLVMTSPPYVTSYEYAELHQLTLYWLEKIKDMRQFRSVFTGSLSRERDESKLLSDTGYSIVLELEKRSKKIGKAAESYYLDMQDNFKEICRVLKEKKYACYVVGNTILKGVPILNAEVFVELFGSTGFKVQNVVKRRIPSNKALPQTRNRKTGRFVSSKEADALAYPHEFIIIAQKT